MNIVVVLKILESMQIALPAIMGIIAHYEALKNDPRLSETDVEKMAENLRALQLVNREDLKR